MAMTLSDTLLFWVFSFWFDADEEDEEELELDFSSSLLSTLSVLNLAGVSVSAYV